VSCCTCSGLEVALLGRNDHLNLGPMTVVKRTSTFAVQQVANLMLADPLCCHSGERHWNGIRLVEETRVHRAAWSRGGGMAARGEGAEAHAAGRRVSRRAISSALRTACCRGSSRPEGGRLYRTPECGDGIPLGRRPI